MTAAIQIHKFGGTSLGDAERIRRAAGLAVEASKGARIVVVASAMAQVTDGLVEACAGAAERSGERTFSALSRVVAQQRETLSELGDDGAVAEALRSVESELRELLDSSLVLGELTPGPETGSWRRERS